MPRFPNSSSDNEQPLLSRRSNQSVTSLPGRKSLNLSLLLLVSLCAFFVSYSNQHFSQFRSTSVHLEGDNIDIRVPTGDCDGGCYCRAVLQVLKTPNGLQFFAGYIVFSAYTNQERTVTSATRSRISKVTHDEAKTWATKLLNTLSTKMDISEIPLTLDDIVEGIMKQKDVAATCTRTSELECNAVTVVAISECKKETDEQRLCEQYWLSPTTTALQSYDAIDEKIPFCGGKTFYYNRASVNAPLCTMDCEEGGKDCTPLSRTVFAKFFVQGNGGIEAADCYVSRMKALYDFHTVVPCGEINLSSYGGSIPVYTRRFGTPSLIGEDECGNLITYAYFKLDSMNLAGDTCASTNCSSISTEALTCYEMFQNENKTFDSLDDLKTKASSCGGHSNTEVSVTMNIPVCWRFCKQESCPPYGKPLFAPATIVASAGSVDCIAASFIKIMRRVHHPNDCLTSLSPSHPVVTLYDASSSYAKNVKMGEVIDCGATVSKVRFDITGLSLTLC